MPRSLRLQSLFFVLLTLPTLLSASLHADELATVRPDRAGLAPDRLAQIDALADRYVAEGRLANLMVMVNRGGRIAHLTRAGTMGVDDPRPLPRDAIFRIYSMSKPIVAVAALMLYEEGAFQLRDPITRWLPELEGLTVYTEEGPVPAAAAATMQQLMTHTAGFSYGFTGHPVDQMYRDANPFDAPDLDAFVAEVAQLPLIDQPGNRWHYSVASDLLGVVVERIAGMPLAEFLQARLFDPLDMHDTGFNVADGELDRVVTNHYWDAQNARLMAFVQDGPFYLAPTGNTLASGGGGLFSTMRDYMRFAEMLRAGGELDGVRILSPKTVAYMTSNHLSDETGGGSGESPTVNVDQAYVRGFGFGLGVAVNTDPAAAGVVGSLGEYGWGGAAGTIFWVDPVEDMVVIGMLQLMGSPWPLRAELKVLANSAITELRPTGQAAAR